MSSAKAFWRLMAKESLYMLLLILVSCGAALLQTVHKKYAGTYSSFIFSGTNYQYNPFMYIVGIFVFVLAAFVLYVKILGKDHSLICNLNIPLRIVTWLVLILWGIVMVLAEFLSIICFVLGLSGNLLPESTMIFTVLGWPVITLIFLGFMTCAKLRGKV